MTNEELKLVSYLARDGMKLDKIRRTLGIKRNVWQQYMRENPQEKRRLELLKRSTDYMVEDALLKRALGYTSQEHRESEKPNGSEAVTTSKDIPPDVRAAALWLKFRKSDMWDKKQERETEIDIAKELAALDEEANQSDDE